MVGRVGLSSGNACVLADINQNSTYFDMYGKFSFRLPGLFVCVKVVG